MDSRAFFKVRIMFIDYNKNQLVAILIINYTLTLYEIKAAEHSAAKKYLVSHWTKLTNLHAPSLFFLVPSFYTHSRSFIKD